MTAPHDLEKLLTQLGAALDRTFPERSDNHALLDLPSGGSLAVLRGEAYERLLADALAWRMHVDDATGAQPDMREDFSCPACGGDVGMSVTAFIKVSTYDVVPGSDMRLHDSSHWECLSCEAEGPLREDGPWFRAGRDYGANVDPKLLEERSI